MKNSPAFTLVEVVVAMLVFTVGLVGLFSTMPPVARMIDSGRRSSRASAVASRQLAAFASAASCDLDDGAARDGGFTISWRVTSEGRIRRATVLVAADARPRNAELFSVTVIC